MAPDRLFRRLLKQDRASMHFRSLRSLVLALAGPCLLAVVAALVVYNLIAAARTQATVEEHT